MVLQEGVANVDKKVNTSNYESCCFVIVRRLINKFFHRLGYSIERLKNGEKDFDRSFGENEDLDLQVLLRQVSKPIIFDVGANTGQSIDRFRLLFSDSVIYSFEPDPVSLQTLRENYSDNGIHVFEIALGDEPGRAKLYLNTSKNMNSLLKSKNPQWGHRNGEHEVRVSTVDKFCEENKIMHIDLLKTDTQGFELQVLQGCSRMMREKRIDFVTMEVIFSSMYEGIGPFDEVYRLMLRNGFRLVSFYKFYHLDQLANWSDALFARVDS
jgi:FkbM family methyltransferase